MRLCSQPTSTPKPSPPSISTPSAKVQDFTPGTDKLELWVYATTAAQVLAGATVSGADTLLHLYQTEIRLVGIAPSQLSTGDIVFGD